MPRVVHFEISAENIDRAKKFYTDVFAWQFHSWGGGDNEYHLVDTGEGAGINGGLFKRKGDVGYVNTIDVPSVDDFAAKVVASGGEVVVPKMAIPSVGWLVYCKDTEGSIFGIMQNDPEAKAMMPQSGAEPAAASVDGGQRNIEAELEKLEKEISERYAAMTSLLKEWAGAPVDDYTFIGAGGVRVKLSELFGAKDDLIVVHNMGARCAYCTTWADGLNGVVQHLEDRAAFVVVSPDAPAKQAEFAASRGWRFRMVSSEGSSFTADMGYSTEKDGKTWYSPGYSTFRRDADGSIRRIGRDFFGPGDRYLSIFHMFDMLDGGTGDWYARHSYDTAEEAIA
jgi:predicted enzyme related to lactoylglutathione lyase/predicted dithiol-disulfide oxidoreductase (DUF899 family)